MSMIAGTFDFFRGAPKHPVGEDGRMAIGDHLRELRARIARSVLVLVIAFIVALFFYNQLLDLVLHPYNHARDTLHADGGPVTQAYVEGATGPLTLQLKLCGVVAVVASSPYWLLQLWGFVVPGLRSKEKRWTRIFAAVAGPLFIIGVGVGYFVLPKGLTVLLSFTPHGVTSLVEFDKYFSFFTRMLLIFGISFEIPLFVILLNLAGIVSGKALGKYRPWIILATFIFAAVATPSTDPFSMLMLAIPMLLLFGAAEIIARLSDRARSRRRAVESTDKWGDDQVSEL